MREEAAAVNQLDGRAVTTQTDVGEELFDFLTCEHGGKHLVVFGADLGKYFPFLVAEHFDEKQTRGSSGLAYGLRLPILFGFYVEDVVAQLLFGDRGRITVAKFHKQAELTVVRMACGFCIEA